MGLAVVLRKEKVAEGWQRWKEGRGEWHGTVHSS